MPAGDGPALAAAMAADLTSICSRAMRQERARSFTASACAEQHRELFSKVIDAAERRPLGLNFRNLNAAAIAANVIAERTVGVKLVVTPNIEHIRLLRKPGFAAAYARAAIICADGFPVAIYCWLRGASSARRVTGCDVFHEVFNHPGLSDHRCFIVVESTATARALTEAAAARGLSDKIRSCVAPPGLSERASTQQTLADAVRAFGTTILILTLGAPLSEIWVDRHRAMLPPCWALCVGQAVRVELGLTRRAPAVWQMLGLEWLWRLIHEPRRLGARYVRALLWFPWAVACDLYRARAGQGQGLRPWTPLEAGPPDLHL